MTVKFNVKNQDGAIQFTADQNAGYNTLNMTMRQKIVTNLVPGSTYSSVTITYNASYPIIAYSCTSPVGHTYNRLSGGQWQATYVAPANLSTQITFYIFDIATSAPEYVGETVRLKLYNPDGSLIYSSKQTPFKIVDWYAQGNSNTYPAGRQYAVSPDLHTLHLTQYPSLQIWSTGYAINGNTITADGFPYQTSGVNPNYVTLGGGSFYSVLDVTGL